MKAFQILPVTLTLVFAISTGAETVGNTAPESGTPAPMASGHRQTQPPALDGQLSAAMFFQSEPRGTERNPNWPKKLTIVEHAMSLDEVRSKLQGQWDVVFHCDGRPVSAEDLAGAGILEGYFNERVSLLYSGDIRVRLLYPPLAQKLKAGDERMVSFAQPQSVKSRFNVYQTGRGQYVIKYKRLSLFEPAFAPLSIRGVKVVETGELLFEVTSEIVKPACSGRKTPGALLAPLALTS